jgi:hypothetical protein
MQVKTKMRHLFPLEFTKMTGNNPLLGQVDPPLMVVLLNIWVNCSHLGAKPAHLVSYLPPGPGYRMSW